MGFPSQTLMGNPPIGGIFENLPHRGHVPSTFTNGNILPKNSFTHLVNTPSNSYAFYMQPMYAFTNMPAYANPNPTGLFPNPLGSVTPFFKWIEDYPLLDGLKIPSYIGSYNGKWYLDNFLHPFKGAIRMQKWLMPVACHMFTYTPKDSAKIWWNSQKVGFLREQSWPLEDIPLEVTIEEGPLMITKTLTFVIVRSDSPHNILLGRTAMQEIGIVVSTVHGAIKFHMPNGVGTIFSKHNSQRSMEEEGNSTNNEGTFPVFCKKLGALQAFTYVYHPHANGQVEVMNREIVKAWNKD
nr:reverse transcriptase domain-containing protein [Tanacetum cinerariifolium]